MRGLEIFAYQWSGENLWNQSVRRKGYMSKFVVNSKYIACFFDIIQVYTYTVICTYFVTEKIMTTKTATRLTIDVSPDFRDELKIQAIAHGKTMKDYVIDTLIERIQKDAIEEDKVWGEMSETAKKEGFIGTETSESLLNRMKNA